MTSKHQVPLRNGFDTGRAGRTSSRLFHDGAHAGNGVLLQDRAPPGPARGWFGTTDPRKTWNETALPVGPPTERHVAHARQIGRELDTSAVEGSAATGTGKTSRGPRILRSGGQGRVILFRFGVVVMFDMNAEERRAFLRRIQPLVVDPNPEHHVERVEIKKSAERCDRMDGEEIRVRRLDAKRMRTIATVLARSVQLEDRARRLRGLSERLGPLSQRLGRRLLLPGPATRRSLLELLALRHRLASSPEVEDPIDPRQGDLDAARFYDHLSAEFELDERQQAFRQQLDRVSESLVLLLGLAWQRSARRLELLAGGVAAALLLLELAF